MREQEGLTSELLICQLYLEIIYDGRMYGSIKHDERLVRGGTGLQIMASYLGHDVLQLASGFVRSIVVSEAIENLLVFKLVLV